MLEKIKACLAQLEGRMASGFQSIQERLDSFEKVPDSPSTAVSFQPACNVIVIINVQYMLKSPRLQHLDSYKIVVIPNLSVCYEVCTQSMFLL